MLAVVRPLGYGSALNRCVISAGPDNRPDTMRFAMRYPAYAGRHG